MNKFLVRTCTFIIVASWQLVVCVPPLHHAYPELHERLPHLSLGNFPTPVQKLTALTAHLGSSAQLFIKRDDLTSDGFGGNKVRKLEYLLADALQKNFKSIATFGCIGSNHVAATAALCKRLGLGCTALLLEQPVSDVVRRNLLLMYEYGAAMILNQDRVIRALRGIELGKQGNYLIPTGGSCPIGVIGYVNAMYELHDQIQQGLMPEPHAIYVATGSVGTVTGILLGLKLIGLKAKVIAVGVEPDGDDPDQTYIAMVRRLFRETNSLLRSLDAHIPELSLGEDLMIVLDFTGPGYGVTTRESERAIALLRDTGIVLDPTYTGKACAALIHDIESGNLEDHVVLYWHTFCGHASPSTSDYRVLLPEFHEFFQ